MTYLARHIITKAYYLSTIVSRGFQSVTGEQLFDGLDAFNDVLAIKSVDKSLIPYFSHYSFNSIIGQEKYNIPNLIEANTVTFNLSSSVRQSMFRKSRKNYFGVPRILNANALPLEYRFERVLGGMDLYLYFPPASAYPIDVWGKFGLTEVTDLDTDLSLVYDRFYLVYLKYELAAFIAQENDVTIPQDVQRQLDSFESMYRAISPYDFSAQPISPFRKDKGLGWADASIGKGWTTP